MGKEGFYNDVMFLCWFNEVERIKKIFEGGYFKVERLIVINDLSWNYV